MWTAAERDKSRRTIEITEQLTRRVEVGKGRRDQFPLSVGWPVGVSAFCFRGVCLPSARSESLPDLTPSSTYLTLSHFLYFPLHPSPPPHPHTRQSCSPVPSDPPSPSPGLLSSSSSSRAWRRSGSWSRGECAGPGGVGLIGVRRDGKGRSSRAGAWIGWRADGGTGA